MRSASLLLIPALVGLAACDAGEPADDANAVVTDFNAQSDDVVALPQEEVVPPPPPLPDANTADPRSPEERGDGDDMVEIIDDTGNRN